MAPINVVEKKCRHIRKKYEQEINYSDDPKIHNGCLLIKGKKRHVKGVTILSLMPIQTLNLGLVKVASSLVHKKKGKRRLTYNGR